MLTAKDGNVPNPQAGIAEDIKQYRSRVPLGHRASNFAMSSSVHGG